MMKPFGFFPQVSRTSPVSKIVRVLLMSLYVPANSSSAAIVEEGNAAIVAASISFLIFRAPEQLTSISKRSEKPTDEVAPFHCAGPPVLQTERIARPGYGRRVLRYGITITPMSQLGQNPKPSRTLACQLSPAADMPSHR